MIYYVLFGLRIRTISGQNTTKGSRTFIQEGGGEWNNLSPGNYQENSVPLTLSL